MNKETSIPLAPYKAKGKNTITATQKVSVILDFHLIIGALVGSLLMQTNDKFKGQSYIKIHSLLLYT